MKSSIFLLALTAAAFSSCTSAYKTGQTPDDVYYSPAKPATEYVRIDKKEDRYDRGSDDYYEDRFLRMRMQNPSRWSAFDDYYFYNTYAYNPYGHYGNWYSPWNSYYTWNNFYNPYYGGIPCHSYYSGVIIKTPSVYTPPSRALVFNPNSYLNNTTGNRTIGARSLNSYYNSNKNARYNNSNSNRNSFGESVRKVFSNSNSDYSNPSNNSTPSRSYNPSSSSSSSSSSRSSSGGSSSGGGSSRPPR